MVEAPDPTVLARQILSFGLPGNGTNPVSILEGSWESLLSLLCGERATGLAVASMEAGRLLVSLEQADELMAKHRVAMLQALGLERKLLALADAFDAAGIEFVVLKGPTLAHTVYPEVSWRPFNDLDLLVRTDQWSPACAVLTDLGFRRDLPEPRPGFDKRFGKAATHSGDGGLQVDLHRTLVLGPFGLWLNPEDLFERTVPFPLAERPLRRLDDTSLLLHACIHASLGWSPPLLLSLRDVAQVAGAGAVDWDLAAELARRWRLAAVVRHAFAAAQESLGASWPAEASGLLRLEPRRREQRALLAYTTNRRARGGMALTTLWAIRGLRNKIAYVRDLAFPSPEFLTARAGGEGGSRLRRLRVAFRWLFRSRRRRGSSARIRSGP
jgi:putative nucleotidyltransferase-like protein